MKALIAIPTYNEIENIEKLVAQVFEKVDDRVHILILDDNSPDGTGRVADQLAKANPRVQVIHRPGKMGLGSAYVAAFRYALQNGYDVVCEMDSDFSHDPKYLPVFLKEIENTDVIVGSRYVRGGGVVNWGLSRKIISRGGSLYARLILGLPIRDLTGGFNMWRRSVIEGINLDSVKSEGYAFQIELKYKATKAGFRIKELPIIFEDRREGQSKMSKKIVFEAMYRVLQMRKLHARSQKNA